MKLRGIKRWFILAKQENMHSWSLSQLLIILLDLGFFLLYNLSANIQNTLNNMQKLSLMIFCLCLSTILLYLTSRGMWLYFLTIILVSSICAFRLFRRKRLRVWGSHVSCKRLDTINLLFNKLTWKNNCGGAARICYKFIVDLILIVMYYSN